MKNVYFDKLCGVRRRTATKKASSIRGLSGREYLAYAHYQDTQKKLPKYNDIFQHPFYAILAGGRIV